MNFGDIGDIGDVDLNLEKCMEPQALYSVRGRLGASQVASHERERQALGWHRGPENVTEKSWYTYRYTFFKTQNFISVISIIYNMSA